MDLGLSGRRALVTAASKGLGRGCAEALAREGAKVLIVSRERERLARTAGQIGAAGHLVADLTEPDAPERVVQAAVDQLGGLDILVTNAGGPPPGTFESTAIEAWEAGFNLTLMSAVRLMKAAVPHLKRSGQGRIVAITSTTIREPIATLVLSNAFRSGLVATMKTLAGELAPFAVTVNNIGPGRFDTDRIREIDAELARAQGVAPEQVTQKTVKAIPMGRLGDPAEFGAVCAFLCSAQAAYLTGQSIIVDGGASRGVY